MGLLDAARGLLARPATRRLLIPIRCSLCVSPSLELIRREITRRNEVRRYRLRGSKLVAYLRHPYLDMWVLDEIFRRGTYEYPDEVSQAIHGLGRPARLVDLGACTGLASLFFLSRFRIAHITAFEPDQANREVLIKTLKANDLLETCTVVEACASNTDGFVPFVSDHFLSRIDPSGREQTAASMPMVDVFPHLADADLIKVDIQGSEWAILTDPRFQQLSVSALVLEYHPHLAPDSDARATATRLLTDAGFQVSPIVDEHAGEGTLWAWRDASGRRAVISDHAGSAV